MSKNGGLWPTIGREVGRIIRRPYYVVMTVVIPLFVTIFMGSIFGDGRMYELPIGVVDMDFTTTSREVVRTLDASPTLHISTHYNSPHEAASATRARQIYGYVVLPRNFEADMMAGNETTIPYFYHYAMMSVGGEIVGTLAPLLTAISLEPIVESATALGIGPRTVQAMVEPLADDTHPLNNPTLNYADYLSLPLLFVMLQVGIIILTTYLLGIEFKTGTAAEWLQTAGGNMFTAVAGKLLPYTLIHNLVCAAAISLLYGPLGLSHTTPLWPLMLYGLLLVLSTQSLALFLFGLYPKLGLIISVTSMIGSLGATLSGVTFPIGSLYRVFHPMAYALPVLHFTLLCQNHIYGYGALEWNWQNIVAMIAVCGLPALIIPRLRKTIITHRHEE